MSAVTLPQPESAEAQTTASIKRDRTLFIPASFAGGVHFPRRPLVAANLRPTIDDIVDIGSGLRVRRHSVVRVDRTGTRIVCRQGGRIGIGIDPRIGAYVR